MNLKRALETIVVSDLGDSIENFSKSVLTLAVLGVRADFVEESQYNHQPQPPHYVSTALFRLKHYLKYLQG